MTAGQVRADRPRTVATADTVGGRRNFSTSPSKHMEELNGQELVELFRSNWTPVDRGSDGSKPLDRTEQGFTGVDGSRQEKTIFTRT